MKHSICIDFPSYEVMVDFVGSFDQVSEYFEHLRKDKDDFDENGNIRATWEDSRFSVSGTEVCDATSNQLFQYFYNGSTGGFDWERSEDGSTTLIRKGLVNPHRDQY